MRLGRILATKHATKVIEYILIESRGYTTVYSIGKRYIEDNSVTWICHNIHSRKAVDMIWNDVMSGLQK